MIKSLQNSELLLKSVTFKTIKNEIKEQRGIFLSMLLGILSPSLIINLLSVKGVIRPGEGVIRAGDGMKKKDF